MLSATIEDYLKTIYKLQAEGPASTSDIARLMEVSSASVTSMVKRLDERGLVTYQSYRGVLLTEPGKKIALEIIRHHRLLELYLREIMNYPWDKVHEEAELLEHHISEQFETKLEEMLGFPEYDPHGDPIPTRDGEIEPPAGSPLSEAAAGNSFIVRRVSDSNPELLGRLEERGLLPSKLLFVVENLTADGMLRIRVHDKEQTLTPEMAGHVFVEPE